jgi:threonine/homoserine/homoserine lactone efflux protein
MSLPGIVHFETFLVAGVLLNLTPGNDTIFILTKSMTHGRRAGIVSALGIAAGSLVHTTLAAFGLSAIIAQSITIFTIVKFAGAAYLVYIGIKMIREKSVLTAVNSLSQPGGRISRIFRDAMLTNVLNPKVALFFVAFLPQFIDPSYVGRPLPLLVLGFCFTATGTAWCLVLASLASIISSGLRSSPRAATWLGRVCGSVLVALGARLAFTVKK